MQLLLTHLYNNELYNEERLQGHYMLIGLYQPYTGNMTHFADYYENYVLDMTEDNGSDNDNEEKENTVNLNITRDLHWYKSYYKHLYSKIQKQEQQKSNEKNTYNDLIENYATMIATPNYIQYELGSLVPFEGYQVVIKKTCWLKIFQRKIRNYLKNKKKND